MQIDPTFCAGFLIYCNPALIIWVSKKQLTIKISVIGVECVAMKHVIKMLRGLQTAIKAVYDGLALERPILHLGDDKSQVTNLTTRPKSTLEKKSNLICFHHAIHESVAMGESCITHMKIHNNLLDPLTESTLGTKHHSLIGNFSIKYDDYLQQ